MTSKFRSINEYGKVTKLANRFFPYFLIIIMGVICYANTFQASFHFDDFPAIIENESIKDLPDLQAIWEKHKPRFLTYLTFAVNYHIHRLELFGYHLFNLIIHLSAALSVYWLVALIFITPEMKANPLTRHAKNIALAVSLVFVSHPIETQAVTYIVQRAASLASLFYFLSLILYIKARLLYDRRNPRHILFYAGSLATALLAMFTKEISATLPLCILICEFFFFSPSLKKIYQKRTYLWAIFATFAVVPLNYLITKSTLIRQVGLAAETDSISRLDYLMTQFNVIRTYLRLLFVPVNQSVDYDYPIAQHFFELPTIVSFLLIVLLFIGAFILFKRFRPISFGIVWFFLTLSVESSVIPIQDVIFEHRLYLPSFGIFLSATVLLFHLLGNRPKRLFALFALIILTASLGTINRNIIWREQVLLWHDAAKKAPNKTRVFLNRGVGYDGLDKRQAALKDYNRVIAMDKNHPFAYLNRGLIYLHRGEFESALKDFDQALSLSPGSAKMYATRGIGYLMVENYQEAYEDFYMAARLKPNNPFHINALGVACEKAGRHDLAIRAFTQAITLDDNLVTPYLNRGKTYLFMGKFNEAIKDFAQAAQLAPDMPEVYNYRGLAYVGLALYKEAILDFTRAILKNTAFTEAYNNRGMAYRRIGLHERAILDLDHAIELETRVSRLYRNRGKIYLSLGLKEEAKMDFERAKTLKQHQEQAGPKK